ncbi:MAG: NEW3 domain-containing protein, partial [Candidatus Aenigmatarchaeota archaeon]
KILLENMGTKGTDVEVRISVNCDDPMTQSMTTFVPARSLTEKLASIAVCNREGLYEVTASIMLFNKTWVSSTNQFFVNASIVQLSFEAPDNITLQAGQSLVFPVSVKNTGNDIINNMQFVVERIPLAWQKTSPSSIKGVRPDETAIFIVNITIPSDAEPSTFEIRMTAAVDETVEKKFSYLTVAPAGVSQLASSTLGIYTWLDYAPLLLVALALAIVILIVKRLMRTPLTRPSYHFDELKKGIYHYNPKKDRSSGRR